MEKHNILGKKAGASAAIKEKLITLIAWSFICFCICLVFYLSKIGLKTLFLTSNKHFVLQNVEINTIGLPDTTEGLIDVDELEAQLGLNIGVDNLFEIDLQKIRNKTLENPAVARSQVYYIFPDSIKIDLAEKSPIARLENGSLIDGQNNVLPPGRSDLTLPVILGKEYKPGEKITSKEITTPLTFIHHYDSFEMTYEPAQSLLNKKTFVAMELIKIKMISINDDDTIGIILHEVPGLLVSPNARLKIPADDIDVALRRACIAIIQNALARRATNTIDARYNSTPTQ